MRWIDRINTAHDSLWGRLAAVYYAHEADSPAGRLRGSVTKPLLLNEGRMLVYSPEAAEFGDGIDVREPSKAILAFIAHQYALPLGYYTGHDNSQLRDVALHRALVRKHTDGEDIPASFNTPTRCPGTPAPANTDPDYRPAGTTLTQETRASLLLVGLLTTIGIAALIGLAIFMLARGNVWISSFAILLVAGATLIALISSRYIRRHIHFLKLPTNRRNREADLLIKQAIAAFFHDHYSAGFIPTNRLHQLLCQDSPLTKHDIEHLGTDSLPSTLVLAHALELYPHTQTRKQAGVSPAELPL